VAFVTTARFGAAVCVFTLLLVVVVIVADTLDITVDASTR
jgi:hypothetical protein